MDYKQIIHCFKGFAATVEIDEANGAAKRSSTTTGTTTNKLVDSGGAFTTGVTVDVGDEIHNTTDSTYCYVTAVDSATVLSVSADIMPTGKAYTINGEFTNSISNTNMGSTDAANLDPVANPVTAGNNTYEKYQVIRVTAMGGSSKIDNLQVWRTSALGGSATHVTNARTTSYARKPYAAPVASSSSAATQTMPSSDPAASNLGIDGSLSGSRTAVGCSDFLVHQIQTNGADTAGSTSTMNYQYDETA